MPDGSKFCMQCGARMGQSNDAQPQKIQPPVTCMTMAEESLDMLETLKTLELLKTDIKDF